MIASASHASHASHAARAPAALLGLLGPLGLLGLLAAAPAVAGAQQAPAELATADSAPAPRVRLFALPVVGYTPETKLAGGLALVRLVRPPVGDRATRPSSSSASLIYTQRGQLTAALTGERWTTANRWRLAGGARYARFPYQLFGVGANAADSAEEEYTSRRWGADVELRRRVAGALYLGTLAEFERTMLLRVEEGGLLDRGVLAGSAGGNIALLGATATWDTRDNVYAAASGVYVQLAAGLADGAFGSDFDYDRTALDARTYVSAGRVGVLAFQGVATRVGGRAPFERLAQIGGNSVMRGYLQGRYRDLAAAAAQAEYRTPIWRRLGAVAFVGVGDVAPTLGDLDLATLKTVVGAGLRYALSREDRLNIRLDYGGGGGAGGTYVTLGEAF